MFWLNQINKKLLLFFQGRVEKKGGVKSYFPPNVKRNNHL
jgi:hypothetical protein